MYKRMLAGILALIATLAMTSCESNRNTGGELVSSTNSDETSVTEGKETSVTTEDSTENESETDYGESTIDEFSETDVNLDSMGESQVDEYIDSVIPEVGIIAERKASNVIGEWGIANKYSDKSGKYEDVYVKVDDIVSGDEAEERIRAAIIKKGKYNYFEAPKDMGYIYIEYEVNLENFSRDKYDGVIPNIDIKAKHNGKMIKVDGVNYAPVTIDITTSSEIYTQGIGRAAILLPDGYKNLTLEFGDSTKGTIMRINIEEEQI